MLCHYMTFVQNPFTLKVITKRIEWRIASDTLTIEVLFAFCPKPDVFDNFS